MTKEMKKIIIATGGLVVIVLLCAGFYFLGNKNAVQGMTIKRITPDQATAAMKGDYFFSDYRQNTLIIKGQVSSAVTSRNGTELTFKTAVDTSYQAYCDLVPGTSVPKVGDSITVLSEGGAAVRRPSGVLLAGCTVI